MTKVFGRALRWLLAGVLAASALPLAAFADDGGAAPAAESASNGGVTVSEGAAALAEVSPSAAFDGLFDHVDVPLASQIGFAVGWNDPACGVPTTFVAQAPGGTGACRYRPNSVDRYQTKRQYIEWVMDPSKFQYQDSPEFQVTFRASGLHKLRFSVIDTGVSPIAYESVDVWVTIDDPSHPSPEAIADRVAAECQMGTDVLPVAAPKDVAMGGGW